MTSEFSVNMNEYLPLRLFILPSKAPVAPLLGLSFSIYAGFRILLI